MPSFLSRRPETPSAPLPEKCEVSGKDFEGFPSARLSLSLTLLLFKVYFPVEHPVPFFCFSSGAICFSPPLPPTPFRPSKSSLLPSASLPAAFFPFGWALSPDSFPEAGELVLERPIAGPLSPSSRAYGVFRNCPLASRHSFICHPVSDALDVVFIQTVDTSVAN